MVLSNNIKYNRFFIYISAIMYFISTYLGWVESNLEGGMTGYRITLLPKYEIKLLSFGLISFYIALFALLFTIKRPNLRMLLGISTLFIGIIFIFNISFINYKILDSLIEHNNQYAAMVKFSTKYIHGNVGVEPTFTGIVTYNTLTERLLTSLNFLGWGWMTFMIGGFLLIISSFKELNIWSFLVKYFIFVALIFLLCLFLLMYNVFLSMYHKEKGDNYNKKGAYNEALIEYEIAQKYYPQIHFIDSFLMNYGRTLYKLNRKDDVETHFYLGNIYSIEKNFESAIIEYQIILDKGSALFQKEVKQKLSQLYILVGLSKYKKKLISGAVSLWEKSLQINPLQVQARYYLSKAYFDLGQYNNSVLESQDIITMTKNHVIQANVHASLGDCYIKLGQYNNARNHYMLSSNLDKFKNYRIIKRLGGI